MADSYVCSGATMKCSMGTGQARLTVLPIRTVFLTGQPMANISDHLSMVNLAPFGRCRSLGFPATASATAANHGVLTPMPCMHNTPFPWMGGKNDYIIKGDPALLKSSTCQCMWGGAISLVTDGQVGEGTQWVSKSPQEEFKEDQVSTEGLTKEDVLDGIQMALDAAGMIPVLGAAPDLLNAAISACRGNWIDAGISLAAAVPGAGDAVGGIRIVKKGVTIAKKVKKGAEATETGAKVRKASSEIEKGTEKGWSVAEKNLSKSDSGEELRRIRAKKLEKETGIKYKYDPKNSETLYDSVESVEKPFGNISMSAHKVKPVSESRAASQEKAVAKGFEKNQSDIKNENETLKNIKEQGINKDGSESLKYQGGKGKDPSKEGEKIDYLA